MDNQEMAKLLEELEELRAQLRKWSLLLNRRLDPAQQATYIHNISASQDRLSQEFTELQLRYQQAQERYAHLHQQVSDG